MWSVVDSVNLSVCYTLPLKLLSVKKEKKWKKAVVTPCVLEGNTWLKMFQLAVKYTSVWRELAGKKGEKETCKKY